MKKIKINKLNEEIFYTKLPNNLDVFYYPSSKTKNFYCTLTVKFGARVNKYKIGNEIKNVIPGSAHFLEHKIMNYTNNKKNYNLLNKLGSMTNAYTDYYVTNYNIFGSIDINSNIDLILDLVFKPKITNKSVEEEKGIINEEIDMYDDDIIVNAYNKIFKCMFKNSFVKNSVIGTKENISEITKDTLMELYNDFYNLNNMFLVITGDFDKDDVENHLLKYFKDFQQEKKKIKILKEEELPSIIKKNEVITKDVKQTRLLIGYKFNVKDIKIDKDQLQDYISMILSINLGSTSNLREKYKLNNLINSISYKSVMVDDYMAIIINVLTDKEKEFKDIFFKDMFKEKISNSSFERKKKNILSSLILGFENIEDVEFFINRQIFFNNKIKTNIYNQVKNLELNECKRILKMIDKNNYSIITVNKN